VTIWGIVPDGSARDAVGKCGEPFFKMDWVLDMTIQEFFDTVTWNFIQKAVVPHTDQKWDPAVRGMWASRTIAEARRSLGRAG
jgi:RNA-directed DNA polymerase